MEGCKNLGMRLVHRLYSQKVLVVKQACPLPRVALTGIIELPHIVSFLNGGQCYMIIGAQKVYTKEWSIHSLIACHYSKLAHFITYLIQAAVLVTPPSGMWGYTAPIDLKYRWLRGGGGAARY